MQPADVAGIEAAGAKWWPLAMARQLDDAILSMRTNELETGTWLFKTEGDAAERAVASPLLEEVNLSGARGVLVNITASSGLKMKEYHQVMETIKEFTADEALVIVGTVIDDSIGDELRVTMIATGLGGAIVKARPPRLEVVEQVIERTGTDGVGMRVETIDYESLDKTPAVVRRGRAATPASGASAFDPADIPAFLRKQAD